MDYMTLELLQEVIDALKQMSPIVWEAYVKAAVVEGWFGLLIGLTFYAVTWFGLFSVWKYVRSETKKNSERYNITIYWWNDSDWVTLVVLSSLVGLLLFIAGSFFVADGLTYIISPEYGAFQNLVRMLK